MLRRSALVRLAGITALALLLVQAGAAAMSHAHGLAPLGPESVLVAGDPALPAGDPSVHDALTCRVCRLRGGAEGDLALRPASVELPLPELLPGRAQDPCRTLHPVWHPGAHSARAPPVLS